MIFLDPQPVPGAETISVDRGWFWQAMRAQGAESDLRELLRQVVADYGRCDNLLICTCSAARAHRYLEADR